MSNWDDPDEIEGLFSKEWRDATDDGVRLGYYIMAAMGLVFGVVCVGYSIFLFGRVQHGAETPGDGLGAWIGLPFGLLFLFGCLIFLIRESRYWDLKHLTAERLVAGGMLTGVMFAAIGLRIAAQGGGEGGAIALALFIGVGAGIFLVSLACGLVCAYLPNAFKKKIRLEHALVVARCVMDEKLQEVGDTPEEALPGCRRIVQIVAPGQGHFQILASSAAFETAEPGVMGAAEIVGSQLVAFHRQAFRKDLLETALAHPDRPAIKPL